MSALAVVGIGDLAGYGLASVRVFGLLFAAPLFGHAVIPARVRIGFAVLVALACAPKLGAAAPSVDLSALALGGAVIRELFIGATLGFATGLVFSGVALFGEFASIQGGLGAATVLDPTSGASSVVMTSLFQFLGLALFLAVDGHHLLIHGVAHSFAALPIGEPGIPVERLPGVVALGAVVFELAVRLAAPITVIMLASNAAVGMLGRAIPQLNLMALQLPAHIAITLLVIGLGATPLAATLAESLERFTDRALATVLGVG